MQIHEELLLQEDFRLSCFLINVESVISEIYFLVVFEGKRESDLIRPENQFPRIEFFRKDETIPPATGRNFFRRHQRTC